MRFSLFLALMLLAASVSAGERLVGRTHVLDGDTIVVAGIHLRLKGVAAPEVVHPGDAGEPGGEEAKAFMVDLVEGQTVVCDLTQERTHRRRVGWCYRDGQDVAEALIRVGLARDCPRYSGGRYATADQPAAKELPCPGLLHPPGLIGTIRFGPAGGDHTRHRHDQPRPVLTLWATVVAERLDFDRRPRSRWGRLSRQERRCQGRVAGHRQPRSDLTPSEAIGWPRASSNTSTRSAVPVCRSCKRPMVTSSVW